MRRMLLVGMAALAAGCAQKPENIAPAYVSPLAYENLDCDQLVQENSRLSTALQQSYAQQQKARKNDTIGVIMLGLPVSSLSGGNVSEQVAQLKGEQQTLQRVALEKRCDLRPATPATTATMPPVEN